MVKVFDLYIIPGSRYRHPVPHRHPFHIRTRSLRRPPYQT